MIIVQQITKTEDGYSAAWSLSDDQMSFLLTYAINALLQEGLVSIEKVEVDPDADEEKQQQLDFLTGLDNEDFHQA